MNLIFLDIDGVLNNTSFLLQAAEKGNPWPEGHLSPELITNLNSLVDLPKTYIVLSSSWRRLLPIEEMERLLVSAGLHCAGKIMDYTPVIPLSQTPFKADKSARAFEIEEWLHSEFELFEPNFVILEDAEPMGNLEPWTVRTDPEEGLTKADVVKGIGILAKKTMKFFLGEP